MNRPAGWQLVLVHCDALRPAAADVDLFYPTQSMALSENNVLPLDTAPIARSCSVLQHVRLMMVTLTTCCCCCC
jgi:hypothetical protein